MNPKPSQGSLSVIVITKDEETNIQQCLSSVDWADEIVVVDAGSTDATVAKARKFTRKVFIRPWEGYGAAKNFALQKANSEWILWIDADERVTEALRNEIKGIVGLSNNPINAYTIPRKANFLGRWILHCGWYPGRVTRLFRNGTARFSEAKVHERLVTDGGQGQLDSDLLHYTDRTLVGYLRKFDKYTTLASEELAERGRKFSLGQITIRPLWTFFRMYVLQRGFLDGIPGFVLCVLSACYVFTKYAKLWEQDRHQPTESNL